MDYPTNLLSTASHKTAGQPPPPLAASQDVFLGGEALVSSEKENNDVLIGNISNGLEAMNNLVYLICEDAASPPRVRHYANMCEEQLRAMAHAVNSIRDQH